MACRPLLEPIRSCPCLVDGDFECYQTICPGVIEDLSECYDDYADECFGEFSGFSFFCFVALFFFFLQADLHVDIYSTPSELGTLTLSLVLCVVSRKTSDSGHIDFLVKKNQLIF